MWWKKILKYYTNGIKILLFQMFTIVQFIYSIKMHKASLLSNETETCSCERPCPDHKIVWHMVKNSVIMNLFSIENLKICFQIRILRVNNTYLTYTMDLHPVGEVLAFSSLSLPEKTFYLRTVRCLLQANPTKICHFHFGALKSP